MEAVTLITGKSRDVVLFDYDGRHIEGVHLPTTLDPTVLERLEMFPVAHVWDGNMVELDDLYSVDLTTGRCVVHRRDEEGKKLIDWKREEVLKFVEYHKPPFTIQLMFPFRPPLTFNPYSDLGSWFQEEIFSGLCNFRYVFRLLSEQCPPSDKEYRKGW